MTDDPIRFSSKHKEFAWLSNFHAAPIELDGCSWPTVEHYYQAAKFADGPVRERIRSARTPQTAKALGASRKVPIRQNWGADRASVMERALRAKFAQHPDLAARLVRTGARPLIEANPRDAFWGEGPDGRGENRLGLLLMRLREERLS